MHSTRQVVIKNQNHNHLREDENEIQTLDIISYDTALKLINDWEK